MAGVAVAEDRCTLVVEDRELVVVLDDEDPRLRVPTAHVTPAVDLQHDVRGEPNPGPSLAP
ncbi:MAG TPA: hypothetical protein VGY54_17905 [Polyangiaceae bacterium]|nr:hypothetical protein [Polyangiaceae bacterium]